ncbi:MAG: phage portal protein [Alcaligenaceae bacterium]|nr:phage portal protein [Alcaligenaceae bacterium]
MDLFKLFRREKAVAQSRPRAEGVAFNGFDDPAFLEYARAGAISDTKALRNMAVLRCVSLISRAIGMLPVSPYVEGDEKRVAKDHPAYRLIKLKPNDWQTPMEFKSQLELSVLQHGDGYARIIRAGGRPIRLIPLKYDRVTAKLRGDWRMEYQVTDGKGSMITLPAEEMFHLRDLSADGETGLSRQKLAQEAIDLALQAQEAARNVFKTGVMAGGAIEVPKALSDTAYKRMKDSLDSDYSGAENVNKWMIAEEGAKANRFSSTAKDAQQLESRNYQVEEVARLYGVPRPLLMMDDTSWGSGIEQLAIFFVQFTLAERFVAWEQALARSLLTDAELGKIYFKFNERALMRGTLKDQADFFAKALGSGGHAPWMTQKEVRGLSELPASDDDVASLPKNPMQQQGAANELAKTA